MDSAVGEKKFAIDDFNKKNDLRASLNLIALI